MSRKLMMMVTVAVLAAVLSAVPVGSGGSYGPLVPGEKVVLDMGLAGYTAKKLPSGLKLDKKTGAVTGSPKKPGTYEVTFTKKGAETLSATFIVGPMPTISIAMEGDIEKCKVTGASKPGKGYLAGKKVNIAAKAPKGTAFAGWYKGGEPWPSEMEYLSAKQKYVMTAESLSLVARFEKEKMSVTCPGFAGTLATGVEVVVPIEIITQSGIKSVKGSKLPSGLKVKKIGDMWAIVGKPKKKGSFATTIKVTARSGAIEELQIAMIVDDAVPFALPEWAVGTFYGKNVARGLRGTWTCPGQITVTVSADGKISMTTTAPGEGTASRTAQLTKCREDGSFSFSFHYVSGRKGKEGYDEGDCEGVISPVAYGEDGALLGCLTTQDIGVCDEDDDPFESKGVVYQSLYSRKPAVAGLPVFGNDNIKVVPVKSDYSDGEVTLEFGTDGAVTATWSGTMPADTCSSYIMPYARDADGMVHAKLWLTFLDKTRIDGYGDFVQTGFEFDLLIPASDKVSASDVDVVSARLTSIMADIFNGGDMELGQQ